MLWGLHHTVNVRPYGLSSLRFLSASEKFLANAGAEYMVSAGSNPVSPDMWARISISH